MPIYAYLFDAEKQDGQVKLEPEVIAAVGEQQLLWIDLSRDNPAELQKVTGLLSLSESLVRAIADDESHLKKAERPRLDLYGSCFHLTVQAVQERDDKADGGSRHGASAPPLRLVTVHFIVFANIVVSLHDHTTAFLDSFDRRIKGDTHLGGFDGPAFLGALLGWHVTGYFRALESLEAEVDRIDDAALRLRHSREERNLLSNMVRVRRRLALVRRTLLPHREVFATLARPNFMAFVTSQATETLQQVAARFERAIEATDNGRDLILGSFDIFSTQTALRTNEVVKTLTIISAILLPAGVIASLSLLVIRAPVYDLGKAGFWQVLALIATIGTTFITVARRRNWM